MSVEKAEGEDGELDEYAVPTAVIKVDEEMEAEETEMEDNEEEEMEDYEGGLEDEEAEMEEYDEEEEGDEWVEEEGYVRLR